MGNSRVNDFLQTVSGGGNGVDNRAAELVGQNLGINLIALLIVDIALVQGNDHGNAQLQQLRGKEQAAAEIGRVHDVDDDVGVFLLHIGTGDAFLAGEGGHGVCAGKVNGDQLMIAGIGLLDRVLLLVDGNACPVADLFIAAGQCVEHRSFTGIRVASQSDSHERVLLHVLSLF